MELVISDEKLINKAKNLAKEHENFYETHVAGGRRALYELLGKIMQLIEEFEKSEKKDVLFKSIRNELIKKYNVKLQENTSDVSALVRYITKSDRKAAHIYTRAIEVARDKRVPPERLSAYIKSRGGIEKLRSMYVNETQLAINRTKKDLYNLAYKNWFYRKDLPFSILNIDQSISRNTESCDFEFFVTKNVDGKKVIVGQVPANQAFQKYAVGLFAKHLGRDPEKAKKGTEQLMDLIKEKKTLCIS
jgi:hypothetical protein